jgi:hypothetical protein
MNDRCKHANPSATCCQCLTETFRTFELKHRLEREARIAAKLAGRRI